MNIEVFQQLSLRKNLVSSRSHSRVAAFIAIALASRGLRAIAFTNRRVSSRSLSRVTQSSSRSLSRVAVPSQLLSATLAIFAVVCATRGLIAVAYRNLRDHRDHQRIAASVRSLSRIAKHHRDRIRESRYHRDCLRNSRYHRDRFRESRNHRNRFREIAESSQSLSRIAASGRSLSRITGPSQLLSATLAIFAIARANCGGGQGWK